MGRHRGTGLTTVKLVTLAPPLMREGCRYACAILGVQHLALTTLCIMVHVCDCVGFAGNIAAEGKTCMHCKARGRQGETPHKSSSYLVAAAEGS